MLVAEHTRSMTDTEIAGEDRVNPFGRKFLKDNTQQAHLRGLRALSHASTAYILPSTQRTDISLQLVMNQLEQIAMLQQRSFSGPAWHGLSVEEIVGDITTAQAVARPPLGQFSIWQHVLHMIFWKDKVTNAMHGEAMPSSSQVTTE